MNDIAHYSESGHGGTITPWIKATTAYYKERCLKMIETAAIRLENVPLPRSKRARRMVATHSTLSVCHTEDTVTVDIPKSFEPILAANNNDEGLRAMRDDLVRRQRLRQRAKELRRLAETMAEECCKCPSQAAGWSPAARSNSSFESKQAARSNSAESKPGVTESTQGSTESSILCASVIQNSSGHLMSGKCGTEGARAVGSLMMGGV